MHTLGCTHLMTSTGSKNGYRLPYCIRSLGKCRKASAIMG